MQHSMLSRFLHDSYEDVPFARSIQTYRQLQA